MAERFEHRMNQSDTTLWRSERDPGLRTTIIGIAILSEVPAWSELRDRMESVTWQIPRLREKAVAPALGIGSPRWVEDPEFDLDYHLRRVVAPAPGDRASLLDLVNPIAMAPFDRSRPLWEITLVEGLADGKAALVQKIHHSATDGVGAIRLARMVFDESETPPAVKPRHDSPPPSPLTVAIGTMAGEAIAVLHLAEHTAAAAPNVVNGVLRHPLKVANTALGTAQSIFKLVRPASEPLSPVMRDRGLSRRLAVIEMSLDDLKAAGHASGGTVNDAFLASVTGGMRLYHERHGASVDKLRVTMPINLRKSTDAIGNNKFTPARFALPIDIADPKERMQHLGNLSRSWQKESGLKFTEVIAGVINVLPEPVAASVMGSMLKAIDFVATNVPGPTTPAHLLGATVERLYAFAPPSGAAFSVALINQMDRSAAGLVIDTTAVRDPEVLAECMADGFKEVIAVGRRPQAKKPSKGSKK